MSTPSPQTTPDEAALLLDEPDDVDTDVDMLPDDEPDDDLDIPDPELDDADDGARSKTGSKRSRKPYADRMSMDDLPPLRGALALSEVEVTDLTMNTINTQSVRKWFADQREQGVNPADLEPEEIEREVIKLANRYIHEANKHRMAEEESLDFLKKLTFDQVAEIILMRHHVCRIALAGMTGNEDYDVIGVYATEGPDEGTYVTNAGKLRTLARRYNPSMTTGEFDQVISVLMDKAERRTRHDDPDMIALANGLFDYRNKVLLPFTPHKVYDVKTAIGWNPDAHNVVIHNDEDGTDWDVESWMREFSDEEDHVTMLWQVIGATVRPNNPWNMSAWFIAESGNNGKGTIVHLCRNVIGAKAYASISLDAFGQDFLLEDLVGSQAILTDENDVGVFIDRAANLKACITGDTFTINRKHKSPVAYRFNGFMIQCVNEKPQTRDRSESLYRRLLLVPFTKSFTGRERKYIKEDYLTRTDVLEYVLHKVLMMDYYSFDVSRSSKALMETYKEGNDPIREFWNEHRDVFVWDLLPFEFCYELYTKWMKATNPSGFPARKNRFVDELCLLVSTDKDWMVTMDSSGRRPVQVRSAPSMNNHESLVDTWGLDGAWLLPNPNKHQSARLKTTYRGIQRVPGAPRPEGIPAPDND